MRTTQLRRGLKAISIALAIAALVAAVPAAAQKRGGTLRLYHNDNPPSASLLEESTIAAVTPFSAVFNNLVVFDPAKVHESIDTIIPDLAESWAWDATNTKLTFKLRQGVKWHDGKPFTAKDVQCTWRMLIGKSETQDFRRNPRQVWYTKLQDVSINGDYEATFELERAAAEPAGAARERVLGRSIPATSRSRSCARGRSAPGRSSSSSSSAAKSIRLTRNPDYWKKDRPYLDEITFKVIESRSTRHPRLLDRRVRHHLSVGRQRPPDQGREVEGAQRDLRDDHHRDAGQSDGQPRQSAVRQRGHAQGHVACDRPQGLQHDPDGRACADGRRDAAATRRRMGHAEGNAGVADRLRSRHRQKPRGSPGDHAEARLRREQAGEDQDSDAKSPDLPRPGGDPDRPAQENLHRRRARDSRLRRSGTRGCSARTTRSAST